MKRIMIVTAALVFMVSGFAFSEETAGAGKDRAATLYNGITYFDTGAEPSCADPGVQSQKIWAALQADEKDVQRHHLF